MRWGCCEVQSDECGERGAPGGVLGCQKLLNEAPSFGAHIIIITHISIRRGSCLGVFAHSPRVIYVFFFCSFQVNISNTWVLPEAGFPVFYRYFRDRISWYEADAVCQFHHGNLVTGKNVIKLNGLSGKERAEWKISNLQQSPTEPRRLFEKFTAAARGIVLRRRHDINHMYW